MKTSKLMMFAMMFFLLAFVNSVPTYASSQTGKIIDLTVRASDGLVLVKLDSTTPNDKPTCARYSYWMIKDENSEVGKKQYSMLLAAHASGRRISITGANECTRWGDGEDINTVVLRDS